MKDYSQTRELAEFAVLNLEKCMGLLTLASFFLSYVWLLLNTCATTVSGK